MKLADYTLHAARHAPASQEHDYEELTRVAREALYREVPSERIAALGALDAQHARVELAALVEQVLNERGIAADDAALRRRLVGDLLDMVLGLGPIEGLLADPSVTEIMVNGAKSVFVERGGCLECCPETFASEEQLRLVVDRIVSPLGRRVDEQQPIVNARLAQGHRVNVVIPPVSMKGTALTIRKFRDASFTLDELVEMGSMSQAMAQLLKWAVRSRRNIAVSGGTGGGKTTLLGALSHEISHGERVVTIEDSAELKFDEHPHVVQLEARMANAEGLGTVSIRDLVTNALRMRPDRIIVGECRGAEAFDMLQAMNTGHAGSLTTLHANAPAEVVSRLVMMVRYGIDLPAQIIEMQIASALDMVVQQDRTPQGARRITQVVAREVIPVGGANRPPSEDAGIFKPCVVWDYKTSAYRWVAVPAWVEDLPFMQVASAEEVSRWLHGLRSCS